MNLSKHYMTKASDGLVSACGLRSYQIAISTDFTNIPEHVNGKCKVCAAAAKKVINNRV